MLCLLDHLRVRSPVGFGLHAVKHFDIRAAWIPSDRELAGVETSRFKSFPAAVCFAKVSMSKKQHPAPEAQVCGWTWPLTSVERAENFPLRSDQTGFFSKAKQIVGWSRARMQIHPNKKNRSAAIEENWKGFWRTSDYSPLWSRSNAAIRFSYLGAIIYFYSNLKAEIRNRRHPKRSVAVPSVSLWKKCCISRWSGRLHPTAANRTQVDELPPSYVCLSANLFLTLFFSSLSVTLFPPPFLLAGPSLAVIPHPSRNFSPPLLFSAYGQADCNVKEATMAQKPQWHGKHLWSPIHQV